MSAITASFGRILIGLLFVLSGINKVMYPAGFVSDLQAVNLPGAWAQGIGVFEIVAGLLLGLGLMTRLVSIVLAIWTVATIFFFYNQFSDYATGQTALRLLAVTGGLLLTFAYGNVRGSLDHYRSRTREQQAQLRAARAEADVEATRRVAAETPVDNRPIRP